MNQYANFDGEAAVLKDIFTRLQPLGVPIVAFEADSTPTAYVVIGDVTESQIGARGQDANAVDLQVTLSVVTKYQGAEGTRLQASTLASDTLQTLPKVGIDFGGGMIGNCSFFSSNSLTEDGGNCVIFTKILRFRYLISK